MESAPAQRAAKKPQFSLRAVFIVTTIFAIACGIEVNTRSRGLRILIGSVVSLGVGYAGVVGTRRAMGQPRQPMTGLFLGLLRVGCFFVAITAMGFVYVGIAVLVEEVMAWFRSA